MKLSYYGKIRESHNINSKNANFFYRNLFESIFLINDFLNKMSIKYENKLYQSYTWGFHLYSHFTYYK